MIDLINKSSIDKSKLKQYLIKRIAFYLNALSEPCAVPSAKTDYYEILNLCHLTESEIKKSMNDFYLGTKFSTYQVIKRPEFYILTFLMYFFLNENDYYGFSLSMKMFAIRTYLNLIHRSFPRFCNPEVFRATLERLNKIHLFIREGSIPNSIIYLSTQTEKRYNKGIKRGDPDEVGAMIQELRTRISQSVKSMAELYYDILAKGELFKSYEEKIEDDEGEKIQLQSQQKDVQIANDIVQKICVYKTIDYNIKNESQKLARGINGLSIIIISEMTDLKYSDNIRSIILVILRELIENKVNICDEKEYVEFLRNKVGVKRTVKTIFLKQQLMILLEKILEEKKYTEVLENQQTKFVFCLFLAYYLGLILKKRLCG